MRRDAAAALVMWEYGCIAICNTAPIPTFFEFPKPAACHNACSALTQQPPCDPRSDLRRRIAKSPAGSTPQRLWVWRNFATPILPSDPGGH